MTIPEHLIRLAPLPSQDREPNPFSAVLPADVSHDDPIAAHVQEQTQQLREQHNASQAGDSTVGWEFMTKLSKKKLYNLGSQGRFYHDKYGIVFGRYVQFVQMLPGVWITGPVGVLNDATLGPWVVTNDFSKSAPEAVAGIITSYSSPVDYDYGWLLVSGANIVPLKQSGVFVPGRNHSLVWSGFETVSVGLPGQVLGMAYGLSQDGVLVPGTCHIQSAGLSKESMNAEILPAIEQADSKASAASTAISDLATQLTPILNGTAAEEVQGQISSLLATISAETQTRVADIARLANLIGSGSVTAGQLNAAIMGVTDAYVAADSALRILANQANGKADNALSQLATADIASMKGQLQSIVGGIVNTNATFKKFIDSGLLAAIPAAPDVPIGDTAFYYATDTTDLYVWNSATNLWEIVSPPQVIPPATQYEVNGFFIQVPTASQILTLHPATRAFTIPVNLIGSTASVGVNPTATANIRIRKNGSIIGTLAITTGGVATFSGAGASVAVGDLISFTAQAVPDTTLNQVGISILGTVP